jgi:hypothetical protein
MARKSETVMMQGNVGAFVLIDDNTPRRRSAAMRNKSGAADCAYKKHKSTSEGKRM